MRLFWKQFLSTVALVLGAFILFGCILIYTSFQMALNREKEQTMQNLQMYQYSMVTSLNTIPDDNRNLDLSVSDIAKTIYQNMGDNRNTIVVYNEIGRALYQSAQWKPTLILHKQDIHNGLQQIDVVSGQHYLECIVQTKSDIGTFYLEMDQNIEYIYENRQQLYASYQRILILVFCITIALAALQSLGLTRPIKRLSVATRRFADGNYESRVKESGNDEVTDLIKDYNLMADKLENSIQELKEAARRQEEFTGAFAHELKTPLTSIIGYSEALCSMNLTKAEQVSSADYIFHQGKRLESLAYKMMELVGIEKQQWNFVPIAVPRLCESVSVMTEKLRQKKNIALELKVEEGQIYGDMDLLESLLANLLDNGRKASKDNSSLLMIGRRLEAGYEIQVIDYGRGIPKDEIRKIHEAFYMVDKSRARKEGGAGIGMSLCEKILNLHKGTWKIESVLGEGTTITLQFPEVAAWQE